MHPYNTSNHKDVHTCPALSYNMLFFPLLWSIPLFFTVTDTDRLTDTSSRSLSQCVHVWHQAVIWIPVSGFFWSFLSRLNRSQFTPAPPFISLLSLCIYFPLPWVHSAKYLLGTPETSLSGLSTLNALSALTSKPAAFPPIGVAPSPLVACSKIALNNLNDRNGFH